MRFVTENQLDAWCRANQVQAQGLVVELVARLCAASAPRSTRRRFPLGDAMNQQGPDGEIETDIGLEPFVPVGKSLWEIGTGAHPRTKATSDYTQLTAAVPAVVRAETTIVIVTPLSGVEWPNNWKPDQLGAWLADRKASGEWLEVRVLDGTQLVDWLGHFPSVGEWMARAMHLVAGGFDSVDSRWKILRSIGDPPPLVPDVFLKNREEAQGRVTEALAQDTVRLQLDTHFPLQVGDFVAACVQALDPDAALEAEGRTVIVHDHEAWRAFTALSQRHVLVADFDLASDEPLNIRLLEMAKQAGHVAVFGGPLGGLGSPCRVELREPRPHQLQEALQAAGYPEERARTLAQQSGGNLNALLRRIQDLSVMPEWAMGTEAAELAIAELLGGWTEGQEPDEAALGVVSGKVYGEWIGAMREAAARPGTPLRHADKVWRVSQRYEAWFALGPRLFDEHLARVASVAIDVLAEDDPKFDLAEEDRFVAAVRGKVLRHSHPLRAGLADTLALMGSCPEALTHCTTGIAAATARTTVTTILESDEWRRWASVQEFLPLLAEAAPAAFLEAIERALAASPSPFESLFGEEGSGITGTNYMTGLLWALETLAWDPRYLTRVVLALGALGAIDPGGTWANRPSNSLRDIFLPWHAQTTASVGQRLTALRSLSDEEPDAAWEVLMKVLPDSHQWTTGSRKPAWRPLIPGDWSATVTVAEYVDQVDEYLALAVELARGSVVRLSELAPKVEDLSGPLRTRLLDAMTELWVRDLPEADRQPLWESLKDVVDKHRKFAHTEWAMSSEDLDLIASVVLSLEPASEALRARSMFTERDFELLDETDGDMDAQHRGLEARRREVLKRVLTEGGLAAVTNVAASCGSPWRVGMTLAGIALKEADSALLPTLVCDENDRLRQYVGGYVRGRFVDGGWSWVDSLGLSAWTPKQVGQFLAYSPFCAEAWDRVDALLGDSAPLYWVQTAANAYEADSDRERAARMLVEHGRPWAAIDVLEASVYRKEPVSSELLISTLTAAATCESGERIDQFSATNLIKVLQADPNLSAEKLCNLEWLYIPLLSGLNDDDGPVGLHRQLATDPSLFCELVRTVWRSADDADGETPEPSPEQQRVALNAYRLLEGWRRVPGSTDAGEIALDELEAWWQAVATACSESGHLGIAMDRVGHMLAFSPPDPGGLWIHRAAASLLDRKDHDKMRTGFTTSLFNARGTFSFTSGAAERELAESYEAKAQAVEATGYVRLSTAVRRLADSYTSEAERQARRDPYED